MEISKDSLRARYATMTDDELATIYVTSDLTPIAKELLEAEMQGRNIGQAHLDEALASEKLVVEDRITAEELVEDYRWFRRTTAKATIIGVLLGLVIYLGFWIAIVLFK